MIEVKKPLVVRIESTMLCNHKCFYCYNPLQRKVISEDTAIENIKSLVQMLNQWGTFDVTFTGGEPFLQKKVLYAGIEEVKKTDMDYGINTNASLITRDDAKRLKDTGVASLFMSFPSYDEKTFEIITGVKGSYKRVMNGFELLANEGLRITANMVVVKNPINNIAHVYDTAKMLVEKFGIIRFATASVSPSYTEQKKHIVNNNDMIDIFEQMVNVQDDFNIDIRNSRPLPICFLAGMDEKFAKYDLFRGCTIGVVNGMTVDLEGNFKPCPVMNTPIANAFSDSLDEIKAKMSIYDGTNITQLKSISPKECHDCAIFEVCKGGCKTEAIAMGSNIKTRSRYQKNIQSDTSLLKKVMAGKNLIIDTTFNIRESVKWRKDDDDTIIIRGEKFAILNKNEYNFFCYLHSLKGFNPVTLISSLGLNKEKFNLFLNKLDRAKLLLNM